MASPRGSFYALSDDEEGEYSTIHHSRSGRGVKLLYSKSKVYVHPTASAKDNIPGFMALLQQKPARASSSSTSAKSSGKGLAADAPAESDILLAWVSENSLAVEDRDIYSKIDLIDSDAPPKQKYLVPAIPVYTSHPSTIGGQAFSIPLSHVYSVLIRPPSIGWWFGSVVINTRGGESLPALFFHDSECQSTINQREKLTRENFDSFGDQDRVSWGGEQVLKWLQLFVPVQRIAEQNVHLVNPSTEDERGFGSRLSADKVRIALEGMGVQGGLSAESSGVSLDPVTNALKEARWSFLEKLSQVTTFTRRTAHAVAENRNLPPQVRRLMQNPQVRTVQEEFDSARLYLARWAMSIAEQSEREKNQRMWTARDVLRIEDSELGSFEILNVEMDKLGLNDRRKPMTKKEWEGFFDKTNGRLQLTVDEVKRRIFDGGLDQQDGVRKEAWLFLLGVHEWNSTREEREGGLNALRDEYVRLKGAWWTRMMDETGTLEEREWWKDQKLRIEKDVHRTDRNVPLFEGEDIPHPDPSSPFAETGTNVHLEQMKDMLLTYNEFNRELGYVQGMSDLLAPIYANMQDDAAAFWAFVGFMQRMERNFLQDQSGMRHQLSTLDHLVQLLDPRLYLHLQSLDCTNFFFFFRMLLVWYKREFEWDDVLCLWERLWTDYLSSSFHLFIAMAILEKHREVIIDHLRGFDEVLKYMNELSNTIDLESTLIHAEALFHRFQQVVEVIDKKDNFPLAPERRHKASSLSSSNASPAKSGSPKRTPANIDSSSKGKITQSQGPNEGRVISPELRELLSRNITVV